MRSNVKSSTQQTPIAIATGSRAEYGLLRSVIQAVDQHEQLALQLIVTGTHLITASLKDIQRDQYPIAAKVRMQKPNHAGQSADVTAVGRGITGFGKVFEQLKPEAVLVLGDRIEAFAAASAASLGGYRVAHLHGGDRAEGVADEAMRHAISKLAHLHFPATPASAKRLKRMGEDPERIFCVGSPAVDAIAELELKPREANDKPYLIVMHHPVGDADDVEMKRMKAILKATQLPGVARFVFAPNHDAGHIGIRRAIEAQANQTAGTEIANFKVIEHLPREQFLQTLSHAQAIVGNSSAGLIEAAVLKTPCVNIGYRQAGREKPDHVIDVPLDNKKANQRTQIAALRTGLKKAATLNLTRLRHPYGQPGVGLRIAQHLAEANLPSMTTSKRNQY